MSFSMLNMLFAIVIPLLSETPQIEQSLQDLNGYRLASLEITGATAFPRKKLIAEFPIRVGDSFNPSRINKGINRIKNLFEEAGYADFKCTQTADIDSKAKTVAVSLNIWQGEQFYIGMINIISNYEESDRKLRKIISDSRVEGGLPFNPNHLEEAARKLKKARKAGALSVSYEFLKRASGKENQRAPSGLVDINFKILQKLHK
jgi:outer membrane translocation and assembly module TamA